MQQTANYQLNQWQKQDRIMMSDFNADNLKLDAALAGLSSKMTWETVRDIVTEEAANQINIDISDVDLTAYACVILSINYEEGGTEFTITAGKMNDSSNYSQGKQLASGTALTYLAKVYSGSPQEVLFLTGGGHDPRLYSAALSTMDLFVGYCSLHSSQISKLTLNGAAPAGLHLKLTGVKYA